jgi:hypothetical protein
MTVIADGMGGLAHGDARRQAVHAFVEFRAGGGLADRALQALLAAGTAVAEAGRGSYWTDGNHVDRGRD